MNDYASGIYYQERYPKGASFKKSTLWMGNYFKVIRSLYPKIFNFEEKRILEIGSSYGGFINLLNKQGFQNVSASDTNKNIFSKSLNNPFYLIDLEKEVSFEDKFDIILAFDVLEHINNTEKVVENIYKVLNHNGVFIFCVPYPIKKHLIDKYHTNMQFPNYYTNIFYRHNFKLLNMKTISFIPFIWRFGMCNYLNKILKSKYFITETFYIFNKL